MNFDRLRLYRPIPGPKPYVTGGQFFSYAPFHLLITATTETMGQLTRKRVSRPPPVQPAQQNDATIGQPNQSIEHIEEDRESRESIENNEASVIMAQQQPQTSRFSVMSPSNRVNIVDTVEPTSKRARLTSPDISLDQSVARKKSAKRENSNSIKEQTKKRRNVGTDDDGDVNLAHEMASRQRRRPNRVASDDEIDTTALEQGSLRQGTSYQVENAEEEVVQHPIGYEVIEPANLSSRDIGLRSIHQTNSQSPSVDGEPGHILQITLQNFMCHEHFTVTLGTSCPIIYLICFL